MNLLGEPVELTPRYNVAPGQDVAAAWSFEDGRRLFMLRWGLLPPWAKDLPLDPYPSGAISARPVSRWVNNAAHDDPRCIKPADSVE